MANTYTQIYIHMVFAVKHRDACIDPSWEPRLHQMLSATLNHNGCTTIAVNGMHDHVHLFFGMKPNVELSHLAKVLKTTTTTWVNGERLVRGHFAWQEGFGAFSYGQSQIDVVANYVRNQKEHHKKRDFREEYQQILRLFQVDFDERYTFQPPQG